MRNLLKRKRRKKYQDQRWVVWRALRESLIAFAAGDIRART
jgi:hypothetical protein